MKRLYSIILAGCIILSACQEEFNVDENLSFAPTILSVYPGSSVKAGDFKIKIVLVDGSQSPLSSATVSLKDASGAVLFSTTESLTGTEDSVVIAGEDFKASALALGDYSLLIDAVDSKNNITSVVRTFKVATQLYAANNDAMFIAGEFNGWGAEGVMELVADNTWEIKNVDLKGGPWKFKNTPDWSDADWGDPDCDKTVEVTTGGGPNTDCKYSGLVHVRFNDATLKYTITPAVTYATNVSGLYLLGSFNNFEGPEPALKLVADNTWELGEFRLKPGDSFKFAESPFFEGKNYGDAEFDLRAEEFGPVIKLPSSFKDGFYKITFNDKTRYYKLDFLRAPFPEKLYLVGGSTTAGWEPPQSIPFVKTGDGKFEIYAPLTSSGGGFKFLEMQDWPGDWGKGSDGKLLQEGEENITVAEDGFYKITADFTNHSFTAVKTTWGIIGDATPGGWDTDTDMTFKGGYTWEVDVVLTAGKFKFRANDGWDINVGDAGSGKLTSGGGDINSPGPGTYHIEMILDPVNGYSYTIL